MYWEIKRRVLRDWRQAKKKNLPDWADVYCYLKFHKAEYLWKKSKNKDLDKIKKQKIWGRALNEILEMNQVINSFLKPRKNLFTKEKLEQIKGE